GYNVTPEQVIAIEPFQPPHFSLIQMSGLSFRKLSVLNFVLRHHTPPFGKPYLRIRKSKGADLNCRSQFDFCILNLSSSSTSTEPASLLEIIRMLAIGQP